MRARLAASMLACSALLLPACTLSPSPATVASQGYLEQARAAVRAQDGAQAMAALDQAESAWLAANEPRANPNRYYERPGLRAIGGARAAVRTGNWGDAARYIDTALQYPGTLGA